MGTERSHLLASRVFWLNLCINLAKVISEGPLEYLYYESYSRIIYSITYSQILYSMYDTINSYYKLHSLDI